VIGDRDKVRGEVKDEIVIKIMIKDRSEVRMKLEVS
jgi:hypothetical protein